MPAEVYEKTRKCRPSLNGLNTLHTTNGYGCKFCKFLMILKIVSLDHGSCDFIIYLDFQISLVLFSDVFVEPDLHP